MANTFIAPPYSFLQLADQTPSGCVLAVSGCLPLIDFNGLKCQLFSNDYVPSDCGGGSGTVTWVYLLPTKTPIPLGDMFPTYGSIPLPRAINNNTTVDNGIAYTSEFSLDTVDPAYDTFDEFNIIFNEDPILPGDCFQFNIVVEGVVDETTTICSRFCVGHTNCFYRAVDACFLSVVKYGNRSNAYGFEYFASDGTTNHFPFNTVTLPIYLRKPQNPTSEASYKLSNGDFLKTYSITDQEWQVDTANIGADWHQKISVMLGHDNIKILSEYANAIIPNLNNDSGFMPVVISEKYEIEWHDYMPSVALCKGKAKVKNAVPIDMINNNCK